MNTSMPGQEGVPSVFSPMARTLEDLVYFSRSLIGMRPWLWDHSVHPIEWRNSDEEEVREPKILKVGVMRTDGELNLHRHKTCANQIKVLLTRLRHVLAPSNAPSLLFVLRATRLSNALHPPPTLPFSSAPNFSTLTVAKPFSHSSALARPTIRALARCPST